MQRVAWFTPLPPVRSGISQYNAELLPALAEACRIDVFVDETTGIPPSPDSRIVVRSAHDFVWMHFRQPYDLVVYQMGNAICHDYMWAYIARYPGLVVLHDGQLHLARGRRLRTLQRDDDYQQEFTFSHPGVNHGVVDLGIRGRLGDLTYLWPLRRAVVQSARWMAVHNTWLAEEIRCEQPGLEVDVIQMGVPDLRPALGARGSIRARHAIPDDAVVFLAFGEITPEKRIAQAIRQLGAIRASVPHAYLLLAGNIRAHYSAEADARAYGVSDRVITAGFVPEGSIADYLDAADVCLCLRWPTSRETSAAWLRCLMAGRPTIITDLLHTTDVPSYDPRSWMPTHAVAATVDADGWPIRPEPACVTIDLLDEDHSLQLAMQRLSTDAPLRARLGQQARSLARARFSLEGMAARYLEVMRAAMAAPMPDASRLDALPAHFRTDGREDASRVMRESGLTEAQIDALWAIEPKAR